MPVNGVRVLPDIPKSMPNMGILIQEFETGFCSTPASCQDTAPKSSTLSHGNFVKKIVEAYESSVKASNRPPRERTRERSDFLNTLDAKNHRNVEKSSGPAICETAHWDNFQKEFNYFSTSLETHEVEGDFVILNRYHSESDVKTASDAWLGFPPKINMYSSIGEFSMESQSSPSTRNKTWSLKRRNEKFDDKTRKKKLIVCSSPLEDVEDKDLNCETLDDILTSSCDSSNNSYRNLQANLYCFEDKQLGLSSTSLPSLRSPLRSSHSNILNNDDGSLDSSSFLDITVTSSKDVSEDRDNLRDSKPVPNPSYNLDQKSPRAKGALPNEAQPVKIDSDTCMTWISTLGDKLSRKKQLKKLLKSAFGTKLLNKKVCKKPAEKQPNERTSDSGFTERFLSSSSSPSQRSWRPNPTEKPPAPPTFGTFGREKNACVSNKTWSKSSRMVLTEVPREEFASESEPSDSISWISSRGSTTSCKENRGNVVESPLKSTMLTNSSTLKASCGYPPHPECPRPAWNGIPEQPFIAETKPDRTTEERMRCDAKEREFDMRELESSGTSSTSQTDLNISHSKISQWLTSSSNCNCNLLRSRLCKSTSALDGLVPQRTPVNNVLMCKSTMDFLSTVHNDSCAQRESCTHRYATVSPKNLRFSMSREKSRAIERSFNA
ncbi:PREDICTED: uncharacterized protein LOC105568505 isoform X2 [Vollenhovia emeryi]|uniref:uncharacterized protein LOC105568505 isoform X1 n=1 Tax=Vollenhovia emeryi TaxID=411798 RepID=UPI0005F410DF|nr:PREDICTED: uncharacterized protein LOC105568505 isoform X1 [Vollenhovia emeryi]XP_011879605.1 PREDICTED: uncharacterized protein LOC105568505 isoform X2 [Vollenhovia emeryi]